MINDVSIFRGPVVVRTLSKFLSFLRRYAVGISQSFAGINHYWFRASIALSQFKQQEINRFDFRAKVKFVNYG